MSATITQRLSSSSQSAVALVNKTAATVGKQLVPPSSALYFAYPLARRTVGHPLYQHYYSTTTAATLRNTETLKRFQNNYSRLYARRILELAAASAASQRMVSQLESIIEKPNAWKDFEKRDWTDDLMETIGSTRVERFARSVHRMVSLSLLASPFVVLAPLSYVSPKVNHAAWEYAIWAIEQSGPTFIKLVQWATTRQDLFSPEFCSRFGKLRDETRGHAWKDTVKLLEHDIGPHWESILKLDTTPIGSGCIAQVYRAILLQDAKHYPKGTEVAVKVQHPGIWTKVCVDFYLLGKVASFLEGIPYLNMEYLSMRDSVHQFLNVMLPQLDLQLEAKHLRRFNQDFSNDDYVSFPYPLEELTTTSVLTETFVHGQPIMNYTKASKEDRKRIATLGLETVLKMIFLNDFVHGDLHPGNILVGKDSKGKIGLRILDCGLVIEMGPDQHVNLTRVLGAFTRRDGRLAGQLMVDGASKCQASPLDVEMFVNGIQQICIDDQDNNFLEKVGDYIADICFLACKHKVKLEASFINAALSVEIIEGIASALYPDMSVQSMALPMVVKAEMMHRLPSFKLNL
eukprot:CAMPEP_0195305694 /NCGR_PEP_ID=MMETSP0707-20130614/36779_1 /TAXON_ID=33640 /ORGANISM="Asterionellopsis glacialis, Strain CCMP134" /LENGTH=572 /DNA_ID=CAMNT_0040369887 /DNA_START=223 /DNA_END=1941 /DNA_ORIENTATION=-